MTKRKKEKVKGNKKRLSLVLMYIHVTKDHKND